MEKQQRNASIVASYLQLKMSMAEIGAQYGITRQRVQIILRDAGVSGLGSPRPPTGEHPEIKKRNAQMRADRATMTLAELRKKYGLTYTRVWLITRGVPGPRVPYGYGARADKE